MMSVNSPKKHLAGSAGALALSALIVACTVGFATASGTAWADSAPLPHEAASAQDASPQPAAGGDAELTIIAGKANRNGTVYTFPNLTVTSKSGKKIRSITVQFTTAIENGDDVTFDEVDGFVVRGKTANRSVNASNADDPNGGWDAAKWEDYLRNHMKINLISSAGGGTKGLRMIASLSKVTDTYDFNSENGHYYLYRDDACMWTEARDRATAAPSYMGMKGYLLTVTSQTEAQFISTLIEGNTWMGGTCLPEFGTQDPTSHGYSLTPSTSTVRYYWVTGPEATANNGKPLLICQGNYSAAAALNADAKARGLYANWTGSEPNTSNGVGEVSNTAGAANKGEYCIHMWGKSSGNTPGTWNDYPNYPHIGTHRPCNYIIEYGGLEDDSVDPSDPSQGGGDADVDVNVDVDVYVKVDINVDPEERTITTEADSIGLGQPLKVGENINGGVLDPVADQVTRTYTLVDADGKEVLGEDGRPVTVPEAEVPYTAGRYKVTSTRPDKADGTKYVAGTATFTVRPAPVDVTREPNEEGEAQPKVYEKPYDGTTAFDLKQVALPGILPSHASSVSFAADSAAYAAAGAGDTKVVLENARLNGADGAKTGNYTLTGVKEDGSLELTARIVPRELVISATSSVSWGLAGKPLKDDAGKPFAMASDEDVHDNASAAWTANMLAPRDAERVEGGGIASILGNAELVCVRDDGRVLDPDYPAPGVYTVSVHFSQVNPLSAAKTARAAVASPLAAGADPKFEDPIDKVTDLGGGRYDIGNYRLTLKNAKVVITENPAKDPNLGQIGDIIEGGPIAVETEPGKPPIDKDAINDIVKDTFGEQLPGGGQGGTPGREPTITIVKDGEEVDAIDPTKPGTYVVVATYPDPDGGPDKVVRFEYTVTEPAPEKPEGPSTPSQPSDPQQPGSSQPGEAEVIVDEEKPVIVDPDGGVMTKQDIKKDIDTRYQNKVPKTTKPEITIMLNGKQVDVIDPSKPGTYYVTAVYHDPNGGPDKVVRLNYVVQKPDSTALLRSTKHRLAQTGDTAPLAVAILGALGGAVALTAAARKRNSQR